MDFLLKLFKNILIKIIILFNTFFLGHLVFLIKYYNKKIL